MAISFIRSFITNETNGLTRFIDRASGYDDFI